MVMSEDDIKNIIRDGIYEAARNIIRKIGFYFVIGWIIISVLAWWRGDFDKDSTDGIERSNMMLHVDALTGCNYLSTKGGGITPRISASGLHYGCKTL